MRRHSEHESKNDIYVKVMIKRLIFGDSDENKITLSWTLWNVSGGLSLRLFIHEFKRWLK